MKKKSESVNIYAANMAPKKSIPETKTSLHILDRDDFICKTTPSNSICSQAYLKVMVHTEQTLNTEKMQYESEKKPKKHENNFEFNRKGIYNNGQFNGQYDGQNYIQSLRISPNSKQTTNICRTPSKPNQSSNTFLRNTEKKVVNPETSKKLEIPNKFQLNLQTTNYKLEDISTNSTKTQDTQITPSNQRIGTYPLKGLDNLRDIKLNLVNLDYEKKGDSDDDSESQTSSNITLTSRIDIPDDYKDGKSNKNPSIKLENISIPNLLSNLLEEDNMDEKVKKLELPKYTFHCKLSTKKKFQVLFFIS